MSRHPVARGLAGSSRLAPSLLSADFARLAEEIACVEAAGADVLHVDVMDGRFVPNLSFGALIVKAIRPHTALPLDVHLMIARPDRYLDAFLDAGADLISVHLESDAEPGPLFERVRAGGAEVGLAISPDTPIEGALPLLDRIDLLLVMTVYPGFGGQSFIAPMLDKVRRARAAAPQLSIEVDGGIDPDTIGAARAAGADLFVAGSAVFGRPDRAAALAALRANL